MHGYLAFDAEGQLLTLFRTWRNTSTGEAAVQLSTSVSVLGDFRPCRAGTDELSVSDIRRRPRSVGGSREV